MRYNDIVSLKSPDGEVTYQARVNWVEDEDAGITYLSPKEIKGGASVVRTSALTLISASAKDAMAERIARITDEELERNIMNIRGRRHPKPTTHRARKKQSKGTREKKININDLFEKMEENPNK